MLPGASGEELVRAIRANSDAPVIVVSARSDAADKVALLKLGADDYLTKPFDLDELHARVAVQLRHAARGAGRAAGVLRFKDWTLDPEARTLAAAGEPVKLTRLEFGIVEALVRRPKKVFTKRELFEAAWHEECFVEDKAVNVHVSNIRGKLRASGTDAYIETVWGIGFNWQSEGAAHLNPFLTISRPIAEHLFRIVVGRQKRHDTERSATWT